MKRIIAALLVAGVLGFAGAAPASAGLYSNIPNPRPHYS